MGFSIGVAVFAAAIGIFVRIQHNSMFGILVEWAHRLAPKSWMSGFTGRAEAIDEAIVATYRRRSALSFSSLLRLVGWAIGVGEVWLATRVLGKPLSVIDSFILESLSTGVRGRRSWSRRVRRTRGRYGLVRGAPRTARGPCACGFSCQTGSRAGVGPARSRGLAMGRRTPFARSPRK